MRAVASFFSPDRRRAYTLVEAKDADEVRRACGLAGLLVVDVLHGEHLARTLLGVAPQPRSERAAEAGDDGDGPGRPPR